ncbi:hypothetical protein D3C84_1106710 [compost metagenome]
MVERADQRVAAHLALAEIAAHVRAVGIEDTHCAVLALEGNQAGAEDVQRMRLAVTVGVGQAETMPAAGEALARTALRVEIRAFHG